MNVAVVMKTAITFYEILHSNFDDHNVERFLLTISFTVLSIYWTNFVLF